MRSKVRAAAFLAMRPHYYPELIRRVRQNIALSLLPPPMGRSRQVAEAWACERALSVEAALVKLGVAKPVLLNQMFPEVMEGAQERMRKCPITMGGGGGIDLLYNLCETVEASIAFETGVAYGFSSLAMLLSLARRAGRLISVDMPYPGRSNAGFIGCVVPNDLRSNWTLLRYPDYIGLPKALHNLGSIDICHYDSDKSYEGRSWAYPKLWDKLRTGGIFVSDDIGDNTAFRDFCVELRLEPTVVSTSGGGGSQERFVGIIVKDNPVL